ncbi:MAG: hypothetical protein WBL19_00790 [Minisyncoccia bacterium]
MKEPTKEALVELGEKYCEKDEDIILLGWLLRKNELKQAQLLVFNCICQAEVDDKISPEDAYEEYAKLGLSPEEVFALADRLEDLFGDRTKQ